MRRFLVVLTVLVFSGCGGSGTPSGAATAAATPAPGAGIDGTALTYLFGSPYDRLPADFRAGVESRVKAVAPAGFDQLSASDQFDWAVEQQNDGLARLDDATLLARYRLSAEAISHMPVVNCAAFTRERVNNGRLEPTTLDAFFDALTVDQQRNWVEIHVAAIEAEGKETPVPRTVGAEEAGRLLELAATLATPDEMTAVEAFGDPSQSDDVRCAGIRAISAATLRVPEADLATLARDAVEQ